MIGHGACRIPFRAKLLHNLGLALDPSAQDYFASLLGKSYMRPSNFIADGRFRIAFGSSLQLTNKVGKASDEDFLASLPLLKNLEGVWCMVDGDPPPTLLFPCLQSRMRRWRSLKSFSIIGSATPAWSCKRPGSSWRLGGFGHLGYASVHIGS